MRILYCLEVKECKNVTEINDIWLFSEDIKFRDAQICFQDYDGNTYISEKIKYNLALSCLDIIVKEGYLNLENYIFEMEDTEE